MSAVMDFPGGKLGGKLAQTQRGAALPLALVLIAAVSIIAAVTFRFVERANGYMRLMQERSAAAMLLASAEAETRFAFLTATATENGLAIGAAPASITDAASPIAPASLWVGDGQWRRSDQPGGPVVVQYRDGGAFVSLQTVTVDGAAAFFTALGVPDEAAKSLAAKLADYQDENVIRQFRGAERAEYRLAQRTPPTNSPIRAPEELARILTFEALPPAARHSIAELASFAPGALPMKAAFIPETLQGVRAALESGDDTYVIGAADRFPSARGRFIFAARRGDTLYFRAIEIARAASALDSPFYRYWVDDWQAPMTTLPGAAPSGLPGVEIAVRKLYDHAEPLSDASRGQEPAEQALVNELATVLSAPGRLP